MKMAVSVGCCKFQPGGNACAAEGGPALCQKGSWREIVTFQNSIVLEDDSSLDHHETFWNPSLKCFGDTSADHILPF